MTPRLTDRLFNTSATVTEEDARRLRNGGVDRHTVEIRPPRNGEVPATLNTFLKGILELQSKWFGLVNRSPVTAFEIRRPTPDRVQFQYSVPTKRLERKLRTQLVSEIPGLEFAAGSTGLPVSDDVTVGGGVLIPGRKDCYPLQTEYEDPPINAVTGMLHRHAMQDTGIVIQVLFQPVVGHPVKHWWWTRNAYQRIGYLRKDKPGTLPWHDRPATPRERRQADAVEQKAGTSKFHTTIRFAITGADEYTPSRVKELAGGFNIFENPETGQYLDTVTVKHLRESKIIDFAETVARQQFEATPTFRTSIPELAALVSLPDRSQKNIHNTRASKRSVNSTHQFVSDC